MNPSSRVFDTRQSAPSPTAAPTGTAQIAVRLSGGGRVRVRLESVAVLRRTGVSGTAYTPFITDTAGAAVTSWRRKWVAAAATAAGVRLETLGINRIVTTDAEGYIYLTISGDVDDTFDYEIAYEVVG